MKNFSENKMFHLINTCLLLLIGMVILVPLGNVLASSFASNDALNEGGFVFFPREYSLSSYRVVMKDTSLWRAYFITISKTFIGVVGHVFFCAMFAYGMSKKNLIGRKLYTAMGVITLFFTGGMIPLYLLMRNLKLTDNFLVYILPELFSYYDVVILMNFFRQVSPSLEESAHIDGAGTWKTFLNIVLPLSKPALVTIALFHGVWQWNDFMKAKLYISERALYPLQLKLYDIITQQQLATQANVGTYIVTDVNARGVQLATILVSIIPVVIVYPLLQKHFVSGMMLGAVKE